MLNKKVSDLLNEQINKELYSGYLYLDMNNYFDKRGLAGFANWYMIQAQEERDHAMLIYKYMQNNDCPIVLNAIAKPDKKYKKDMDVLKAGLEHEEYVTASIHTIYDAAYKVKDFRTMQFLDWFVPRLVRQGAGRGGDQRPRHDHQDGAVRQRPQEPLHAQPGTRRPRIQRPQSGARLVSLNQQIKPRFSAGLF